MAKLRLWPMKPRSRSWQTDLDRGFTTHNGSFATKIKENPLASRIVFCGHRRRYILYIYLHDLNSVKATHSQVSKTSCSLENFWERSTCVLNVKVTDTDRKHFIRYIGSSLWAKLTKHERTIKALSTFRTMIREKDNYVNCFIGRREGL